MDTNEFLYPGTEFAVQLVVWATQRAGIIMVAASGNDDLGQQYPAAFVPVLGVGAYGLTDPLVKACYSNLADVYEPGGESLTVTQDCDSIVLRDCLFPDCPNAVVSVIGWPDHWRIAFWSGTSFAAPLASGMVALKLYDYGGAPTSPDTLVDSVVTQLQDLNNCELIEGHCKLDLDKVLNIALP
jgi:hypothetical protein